MEKAVSSNKNDNPSISKSNPISNSNSNSNSKSGTESNTHILNAFNYKNIVAYTENPVFTSIMYFILLSIFVIMLFSTTYITISSVITIYYVYILLKQIYYVLNDKKGTTNIMSFIVPVILIIITILCNYYLPKSSKFVLGNKNEVIDSIQDPIYNILYISLAYGIFFVFMLIYNAFSKYAITLLIISFLIIIIFSLYYTTSSSFQSSITKYQVNQNLINTLIFTPLVSSCLYIVIISITYGGDALLSLINNSKKIKDTTFTNNFTRITPLPTPGLTDMEKKLKDLKNEFNKSTTTPKSNSMMDILRNSSTTDLSIYIVYIVTFIFAIVFISLFVTFLNIVSKYQYNSLNELVIMIINGFILAVITILTINMVTSGMPIFQNDATKAFTKQNKINEIKRGEYFGRLGMENSEKSLLALLIIYNVAVANILNHDYFNKENDTFVGFLSYFLSSTNIRKYENSLSTIGIMIVYIVTFILYYRVIMKERNIQNDSEILMFYITLILFISVLLYINNSKVAQGSSLNQGVSPYIYAMISYAIIFGLLLFIVYISNKMNSSFFQIEKNELTKIITICLFILFGVFFLFTLINWLINLFNSFTIKNKDGSSSIFGIILNLAIIITLLAIIFRMITYSNYFKNTLLMSDNPLIQLVIGSIFYIPCLLIAFIDIFTGYFKKGSTIMSNAMKQTYNKVTKKSTANTITSEQSGSTIKMTPSKTDIILLILIILLYIIYYSFPYVYTLFSSQGGQQLLKEPVYTNKELILATYTSLNPPVNSTKQTYKLFGYDFSFMNPDYNTKQEITHSYNYAISSWIFIDSNSSVNSSETSHSLINYGDKPNVLYKSNDNCMIITIKNTEKSSTNPALYEGKQYDLDKNGNVIIYKYKDVPLQKWNNIVINYNSGILDIFINGKLQKSIDIGSIPYMTLDNITIGEKNGLNGGICNVVYFSDALNINQVYYMYTSVKDLNPPIMTNYYETIFKLNY